MHVAPALCTKPTVDSTQMSWDKVRSVGQVVSTETSYGLEVEGLGFLDRLYDPPSLPFGGHRDSVLRLKRPGPDVDHSPPTSYGVKNYWNHTLISTICFHGVNSNNFTS